MQHEQKIELRFFFNTKRYFNSEKLFVKIVCPFRFSSIVDWYPNPTALTTYILFV